MEMLKNIPSYLKDALTCELFSASVDIENAADELQSGGEIDRAEALLNTLTQRLSLLSTAAICMQVGNEDHANRILEYICEHKMKSAVVSRRPVIDTSVFTDRARQVTAARRELCLIGSSVD
jgi:hypothetical protein